MHQNAFISQKAYKATFVPRLNEFASMFIVVKSATHLKTK